MRENEIIYKFAVKKMTVYKMNNVQTVTIFNGAGICDDCGTSARDGYYVPVLNLYLCQECFDDWCEHCKHYKEDDEVEEGNVEWFEMRCRNLGIMIMERANYGQ